MVDVEPGGKTSLSKVEAIEANKIDNFRSKRLLCFSVQLLKKIVWWVDGWCVNQL